VFLQIIYKFSGFLDLLKTIYHRAIIFHMLIGLGKDKTPINIWFTRSKVKVTWVTFFSLSFVADYHKAFIFNKLICLGEDMNFIAFGFTRPKVKVTKVLFIKQWFPLIVLRNIYYRAILFHMLIGLGDFGFTMIKVKVTRVTCQK